MQGHVGAVPGPHGTSSLGIRAGPQVVDQCRHHAAASECVDRRLDEPAAEAGIRVVYGCRHQRGEPLLGQTCTFEQGLTHRMGEVAGMPVLRLHADVSDAQQLGHLCHACQE